MNWGRAKIILIVMFLLTDAFLLIILLQTKLASTHISTDIIGKTVEILESRQISVTKDQIPVKREKNRNMLMRNHFDMPEKAAAKMLGTKAVLTEENQEAHVYRFESDQGSLTIKNNSFTYKAKKEVVVNRAFDGSNEKFIRNYILSALDQLGFERNTISVDSVTSRGGLLVCEAIPVYRKTKVYGICMEVKADSEGIISISGNWFVPVQEEFYENESLTDITTVLTDLVYRKEEQGITKINKIEMAFYVSETYLGSRELVATPAYVVLDQKQNRHYFDARSGKPVLS